MSRAAVKAPEPGDAPSPRSATVLIGQDEAERALLAAHASGRMHHAWLLTGPGGIGKATLAYRFARFLLAGGGGPSLFSGRPESLAVDPRDPAAQKIAAGSHPDLAVLERTRNERGRLRSEILIDPIRTVRERLRMTAAEGGWRIVLADGVEDMNRAAANAFLKMLEEPPQRTVLLLVSHNPGQLLPTIRSRCRRLAMRTLDEAEVVQVMRETGVALPETDMLALARLSEGSAGLAIELARQGGLDVLRETLGLLDTLPALDRVRLYRFADRLAPASAEAQWRTFQRLLPWWLGRLVRHQAAPAEVLEPIMPEEPLHRLAGLADPVAWLDARAKIERLLERTDAVHLDVRAIVLQSFLTLQATAR